MGNRSKRFIFVQKKIYAEFFFIILIFHDALAFPTKVKKHPVLVSEVREGAVPLPKQFCSLPLACPQTSPHPAGLPGSRSY